MAGRKTTAESAGATDAQVEVVLPSGSPFERVGPYARGQVVAVSPEEARRLIEIKGFVPAEAGVPDEER